MCVDHDLGRPADLRQRIPGRVDVVEDPHVLTLELDQTPWHPRCAAPYCRPGVGGGHDQHAVKAEAAIDASVLSAIRLAPHSREAALRRGVEVVLEYVRSWREPLEAVGLCLAGDERTGVEVR